MPSLVVSYTSQKRNLRMPWNIFRSGLIYKKVAIQSSYSCWLATKLWMHSLRTCNETVSLVFLQKYRRVNIKPSDVCDLEWSLRQLSLLRALSYPLMLINDCCHRKRIVPTVKTSVLPHTELHNRKNIVKKATNVSKVKGYLTTTWFLLLLAQTIFRENIPTHTLSDHKYRHCHKITTPDDIWN